MTMKNMFTEKAQQDGIGHFETEKLKATIEAVVGGLDLPRTPAAEEVATNDLLPQ
jgi:hypothetical protein